MNTRTVLILSILLLIITLSCTARKQSKLATKDAIEICGCNRPCIIRILNIKGITDINESEFDKHCK